MENDQTVSTETENSGCAETNLQSVQAQETIVTTEENQPENTQIEENAKYASSDPIYDWKDITQEFFEAVKELSLGELVHHQMFGLFEAMSAIEMMDPKMDAGMCCNKNTSTPLTFETAISTNQLKLNDFNSDELIGIMDGIYSCLVSWLEGHSLSQTLFTCLYLHQPYRIEDKTLKAFCIAMHKLTQIIRKFITHAQVFEEEDFEIRDYEYNLMPDTPNARSCYMLKEVEDELMKKIRNTTMTQETEDLQAIVNRLRFLRHLLQSLIAIWPDKKVSATEPEMGEIQKLLTSALDAMPMIKKTIAKGTQPEPNSDAPNPMGFSPMVNQRILPPTFPRYTKIKDRMLSMNFLDELVQRIKIACKVIYCTNYHNALNFFIDFSRKSGPCLLSRSILQCIYFPQPGIRFGTMPLIDVLRDSVKTFVAPPVLQPKHPLSTNPQAIECVEAFFKNCVNMYSFVTFVQICGFNKARQRDKLAHLLDDFSNLEDGAERVDAFLHSPTFMAQNKEPQPYFSTWILYYSLKAMSMYLLSGLELELYSLHEYIYIFWYLSQFLSNWIVTTLSRAECLSKQMVSVSTKDKKKPKVNKKKQHNMYYREIVLNQAFFSMFSGYFKAVAGFTKEKRIPQPLSIFDDEKIRFEHRFAPFIGLTTLPPVTYGEFTNMRLLLFLKHQPADLFSNAAIHFQKARCILESMLVNPDAEIQDIIRVAKTNYVVMNLLANGHKKDSTAPPEFDFSIHRYFPIIKP